MNELLDDGFELSMEMMRELPKRVLIDVIEEEGLSIFSEDVTINTKIFRKCISRKCGIVLRKMIR